MTGAHSNLSNVSISEPNAFFLSFKDVSLERVKTLIKTYLDNYEDVTFRIRRTPKYYICDLRGGRVREGGLF